MWLSMDIPVEKARPTVAPCHPLIKSYFPAFWFVNDPAVPMCPQKSTGQVWVVFGHSIAAIACARPDAMQS